MKFKATFNPGLSGAKTGGDVIATIATLKAKNSITFHLKIRSF